MSEPTIEIPARLALKIAKQLRYVDDHLFPGRAPTYTDTAQYLQDEIVNQCTDVELKVAIVAAQIEESA